MFQETLAEFYYTFSSIMDPSKSSMCDNEGCNGKDFDSNYESPQIKKKDKDCESTNIPIDSSEKTKMGNIYDDSSCPEPFQNFEEGEYVKKESMMNCEISLDEKDLSKIFKF